jgi:hypothetical protein
MQRELQNAQVLSDNGCRDRNERMSVLAGNLRSARRKIFLRQRKEGNGRVGDEGELIFALGLGVCREALFFFKRNSQTRPTTMLS